MDENENRSGCQYFNAMQRIHQHQKSGFQYKSSNSFCCQILEVQTIFLFPLICWILQMSDELIILLMQLAPSPGICNEAFFLWFLFHVYQKHIHWKKCNFPFSKNFKNIIKFEFWVYLSPLSDCMQCIIRLGIVTIFIVLFPSLCNQ